VAIEVIPGFVPDQSLEVVAVRLGAGGGEQAGNAVMVHVAGDPLGRHVLACSLDLREPGEYRVDLWHRGGDAAIRTLEITARAPVIAETGVSLEDFLESWPSGEPALANVVLLYRFLRTLPEPWAEFSLYTLLDQARGAISDRRSVLYRLVDTLLAYLDDPPRGVTRVALVRPDEVPPEILPDVGTVVLHLQLCTEEALRADLSAWEAALTRGAGEGARSAEERAWLLDLALAAGRLRGGAALPVKAVPRKGNATVAQPYFPCRENFLRVLRGRVLTKLATRGTT
jgi:hypothetical protein